VKTIVLIGFLFIFSNYAFSKGSSPPSVNKTSCEKMGFENAANDDQPGLYRGVFLPPASKYGGNDSSGMIKTGGIISCLPGMICYGNQNYIYRLTSNSWANKNCSKKTGDSWERCLLELGKTKVVIYPKGSYSVQFQISHGASKNVDLGEVRAFEITSAEDGRKCLKKIGFKKITSLGPIHKNLLHGLETPSGDLYQRIYLDFESDGINPILFKTYWFRDERDLRCKIFDDCWWLWQGAITVLKRDGIKKPIFDFAHRRNNIVRLDSAFMSSSEFNYAYNPQNGVIARLSQGTFDYYYRGNGDELLKSNGEGANCAEMDITPVFGDYNQIKSYDSNYQNIPSQKFIMWHPKAILETKLGSIYPNDFFYTATNSSQGGGINAETFPGIKGWGTLPSGAKAQWLRVRQWLEGRVPVGNYFINRKASCIMLDTKMTSWPNSSSAPYGEDFEKYAIDLISLLKNEMGFDDKIFSRIIFSIPGRAMEKFKKGADSLFQNGFPGAFDAYLEESYPSSAKQYVDDAEKWGANFLGIGVDSFIMEKVQKDLGSIPIYPPNSWWAWVAEMSNRRDQTGKIKKAYFWTVDQPVNQRQALDYGVDGIISNWPSRVRVIIQDPPYNRYYRLASPNDPIK
jgi:hypothetical protein